MNETEKENAKPQADPATGQAERDKDRDTVQELIAAMDRVKGAITGTGRTAVLLHSIRDSSDEVRDQAQQSMFQDIDAILARLETGIAAERTAMDALLDRLTSKAA
jgi:hypothetical protein